MAIAKKIESFKDASATSLKGTSFTQQMTEAKRRLIMAIDAPEKCGKTNFALSAPGPIAYVNFDQGLDSVIQKFQKLKKIYVAEMKLPRSRNDMDVTEVANAAAESWNTFCNDFMGAVRDTTVRTIVTDTATELWELLRLAKFGKLAQVMPHQYAIPNSIYREMIREVENSTKNLILIHKVGDEYVNDKRTGKKIRSGYKDTGYIVQVNANLWKVPEEEYPDRFHLQITDCRQNPECEGTELTGDMVNFATVATMVFPESELEDWQ
jgi:hypothetical protein